MTTFYANSNDRPLIALLVFTDVKLLDVSGALQVFSDAEYQQQPVYNTCLTSLDGGLIRTDTGVFISTVKLTDVKPHTLLIAGGKGVHDACKNPQLINTLTQRLNSAYRTGSICTGAFLLAATGICSGKNIATHWQACQRLADSYPELHVDPNSIYVEDGVWSSAGVTAGIDMALAMVAEDIGRPEALRLAKSLVTYMVRPGNQSQFSIPLELQNQDSGGRFDTLHSWIRQNLHKDLSIEVLAAQANMSIRSFHRHYCKLSGNTPAKAITQLRLEAARDLLVNSNRSIERIAEDCGFTSIKQLQRSFQLQFKTSPSRYRALF
ncbi:GlxA family transcriptional regulator [Aliamphritea ceti]|uniref:GlxA family transcriptional regulator n=1 Tax=Aliamphritea ceti TaxID=1524258 RepID=UPI0021C2E5BF|nr:helix-turn-helix domain-containing protein [Aliamphritea ceti]